MVDGSMNSLLREHVLVALARGEDDFETVVADGLELLDGEAGRSAVDTAARAGFAAYREEQRGWNGELLDSERLLAAFRDLDLDGVVARADFTCCQSCGMTEIADEAPAPSGGYVFCHRQDVDAAARGEGLFLSYGTLADDVDAAEIGRRVVKALRSRGLTVDWDGEITSRIHLPLTWRRRRYAHLALAPGLPDPDDGALQVTYCDYTRGRQEDDPVAMSFEAFRGLLFELVPSSDNFVTCQGRSGAVVQGMWDDGPRFWLETPDTGARCSYGRWVTLDQAARVVHALADDGRVALTDLGDLETVAWT
jgi:hypothetical protein